MIELWRNLRDHLKVSVHTEVDESPDAELPAVVEFTVTNTAGVDENSPEIIFQDVVLSVGGSTPLHDEQLGTLRSGESAAHVYRCRYSDLPDLGYALAGTVSPEAFFRTREVGQLRAGDAPSLSIPVYLQVFNELAVHLRLSSAIKSVPVPSTNPESTEGHRWTA